MAKKIPKLPTVHSLKLGTLAVQRGNNNEGEMTYCWDVGQTCMHQACPAINECHYEEHIPKDGKCKVLRGYLRSAAVILYETQVGLSAAQRYQIGMHLIPLYKTLCKMKIEEAGIVRVLNTNDRGTIQVNPLYREIRDTIKVIDAVWRSIGVQKKKQPKGGPSFGESGSNYYDAMEKAALDNTKYEDNN